jgi:hypothetical protein
MDKLKDKQVLNDLVERTRRDGETGTFPGGDHRPLPSVPSEQVVHRRPTCAMRVRQYVARKGGARW